MAPKAPEKSPQSHQQPEAAHAVVKAALVKPHSSPFYISAHYLCHNKRLKQKRSKYAGFLRNALSQARNFEAASSFAIDKVNTTKTDDRRQRLSHLTAEVTIDLLSDDEDDNVSGGTTMKDSKSNNYRGRMSLERAAILGLMPVERLQNGPPPLIPIVNRNNNSKNHIKPIQQPTPQLNPQQKQKYQLQPRKRKSRPQKRKSLPPPVLLNYESIVLSDDSDAEVAQSHIPFISPSITIAPDLTVVYPSSQQIPCNISPQNTMQVDEEVTISLVPRSSTCTKRPSHKLNEAPLHDQTASAETKQTTTTTTPPFPMLPDETTVHTVIANRIYELSLTKLREGLASCGIPEFNGGPPGQQKKISPPRRKGAVQPPPEMISPPQAPISLKLSSDLSISLISDDEDETSKHHQNNENILSPAFLQKLPVNVSIAPVNMTTPRTSTMAVVDPRKLKFG